MDSGIGRPRGTGYLEYVRAGGVHVCECEEQSERMRPARPSRRGWCKMWTILEAHEMANSSSFAACEGAVEREEKWDCTIGWREEHGS